MPWTIDFFSVFVLSQIEEEAVDPVVQLKLLCSAGGEVRVRYDTISRHCEGSRRCILEALHR